MNFKQDDHSIIILYIPNEKYVMGDGVGKLNLHKNYNNFDKAMTYSALHMLQKLRDVQKQRKERNCNKNLKQLGNFQLCHNPIILIFCCFSSNFTMLRCYYWDHEH